MNKILTAIIQWITQFFYNHREEIETFLWDVLCCAARKAKKKWSEPNSTSQRA